jgi:signal transduction histidine kinase
MNPWLALLFVALAFAMYAAGRERAIRTARSLAETRKSELDTQKEEADKLREIQQWRADAVAQVTHELKTPLTSLLGYATILRKRADTIAPEQRTEFIALMEKQGQRILRLIEELLQSSRLDSGQTKLQRAHVDLPAIARDVAREIGTGRGRQITVDAPPEDLGLFGDAAALEHVLTNLIDNALKYSGDDTTVRIAIGEGEGEIFFTVSDEGRGIPADQLTSIFERFQQASNARGGGSVGLGLYIVRSLVQAHGGTVWADSDIGKGTTFTVTLPRRRARSDQS